MRFRFNSSADLYVDFKPWPPTPGHTRLIVPPPAPSVIVLTNSCHPRIRTIVEDPPILTFDTPSPPAPHMTYRHPKPIGLPERFSPAGQLKMSFKLGRPHPLTFPI